MSQSQQFMKVQYAPHATDYDTEGTPYTELARVQSCNLNSENSIIYDRGLGEGLNVSNAYYGPFNCDGSISFDVTSFDFLKHWIGPKSGSGTSGDKYTLTEATGVGYTSSDLQPFSIERLNDTESTDTVDVMIGAMGTTFTLSGSIGTKLNCSANFIGAKTLNRATHTAYTADTSNAFVMIGGTWKWGATPSTILGVRSFSISYDNGLVSGDATRSIESRLQKQPLLGLRTYNFSVDIIMSSTLATTILADFYGQAATSGPIDSGTKTSPTSSLEFEVTLINASDNATIGLDETVIDRISRPSEVGGGIVVLTFEGTAFKGKSNAPIKWWST